MTLEEAKAAQKEIQDQGKRLLAAFPFEEIFNKYGEYVLGGSFRYGLMLPSKGDIDGYILVDEPNLDDALRLADELARIPEVKRVVIEKILEGDWAHNLPSMYVKVKIPFENRLWNFDIHMAPASGFVEYSYLNHMEFTPEQHDQMLLLKAQLKEAGLYGGRLPGSFSSTDVYSAVLEDGVQTVEQMVEWGRGRVTYAQKFREANK